MWCYQKSTPWNHQKYALKPPKPALPWININKRKIQWCWSLPCDSELLCCAGFGQVCFCLSYMANGVCCHTSRVYLISHVSWLIVDSILTCIPQWTESPLPMHFLRVSYQYLLLYIVVPIVGVSSNVKSLPVSPTKKWWKSWLVGQKQTRFPSPSDRNHSPMLVDCCIMCFYSVHALGVEAFPSEPPKKDTSIYPKIQR